MDGDPDEISQDDGDEEQKEEILSSDLEHFSDIFFSRDMDRLNSINSEIRTESTRIDVQSFQSADLDNVREAPVRSPLEAYSDAGNGEIEAREEKVQKILDKNASPSGDAARERRSKWNTSRYLLLVGIIAATTGVIIYEVVARAAAHQDDADIPLSDEVKAEIRGLVEAWQAQPDAAFWGSMASYVQTNSFTLADLVYFMQYTMDLNPLTKPFFWDHAADPDTLADGLEATYRTGGAAALLNAVPGLLYKGAALPRYEQAYVARTAFAALAAQTPTEAVAPTGPPVAQATPIVLYVEGGRVEDYLAEREAATPRAGPVPFAIAGPNGGPPPMPRLAGLRRAPPVPLPLLLPGERLKAHAQLRLVAPWLGMPAGTPIHLAYTDRAVLAWPAVPAGARFAAVPTVMLAEDPGSAILQFTATAAFALPEPFGALASGVISAIGSFFGGNSGPDIAAIFAAAMQKLLDQISLMLATAEISDAAKTIQESVQWLADKTTIIQDLQGQDPHDIERTLRDDLLPSILAFLDPTTGILSALTSLYNFGSTPLSPLPGDDLDGAKHWQQLRENAFQTLVSGVGTYLSWLRIRLQWQAALETQQAKDGTPVAGTLVYDYFDQFRLAANLWVTRCSQRLGELYADRSSFVSHSSRGLVLTIPPYGQTVPIGFQLDVRDDWNGVTYETVSDSIDPAINKSDPNSDQSYFMAHTFGPAFDAEYSAHRTMLQGFTDAIADWNKKIAPPKPSNLAVADSDLSKWGADAPQGRWVSGASVCYAIDNVNGAGTVTAGDWGDSVKIGTRAFALVSQIPVDALGLTVARHLRRQFTDPGGTVGAAETVAIIANNTDTSCPDNTP